MMLQVFLGFSVILVKITKKETNKQITKEISTRLEKTQALTLTFKYLQLCISRLIIFYVTLHVRPEDFIIAYFGLFIFVKDCLFKYLGFT